MRFPVARMLAIMTVALLPASETVAQAPCQWTAFSAGGAGSNLAEQRLTATSGLSCRVGPISGSLNSIRVMTPPSRGRVEMQGAFYTYTPTATGPGQDFFQLSWWPVAGQQQILAVRVTIVGNGPGPSAPNNPVRK